MEIRNEVKIDVRPTLKELAILEDKSLRLVDGEQNRVFELEGIKVEKNMLPTTKENPITVTATIIFNLCAKNAKNELDTMLKKLLKMR